MAANDSPMDPKLYLSPNQQNLLLTALNSNKPSKPVSNRSQSQINPITTKPTGSRSSSDQQLARVNGYSDLYTSPVQQTPSSMAIGAPSFDESPYMDEYLEDGNFDWDNNDTMIGSIPGNSADDEDGEHHDKRKNLEDDQDEEDGGGKRRESDDKTSKKPGRKPLTSEPTSVLFFSNLKSAKQYTNVIFYRNARLRTGPRKELSGSVRKDILKNSRPRSMIWRKPQNPPTTKMVFCVPRWIDFRPS